MTHLFPEKKRVFPPRFEGLNDDQWALFEPLLPQEFLPEIRGPGKPPSSFRCILNTIMDVLLNGSKWKAVPKGPQWGARSTSHRWLGRWKEDNTWEKIAECFLGMAADQGLVDLERGSVDGMFVAGKGGGDDVEYGYKGKGCTLHHLVDNNGRTLELQTTPANVDERSVVVGLLEEFERKNWGPSKKRLKVLQGDKGYQDKKLHRRLRNMGISPLISRKDVPGKKKAAADHQENP